MLRKKHVSFQDFNFCQWNQLANECLHKMLKDKVLELSCTKDSVTHVIMQSLINKNSNETMNFAPCHCRSRHYLASKETKNLTKMAFKGKWMDTTKPFVKRLLLGLMHALLIENTAIACEEMSQWTSSKTPAWYWL